MLQLAPRSSTVSPGKGLESNIPPLLNSDFPAQFRAPARQIARQLLRNPAQLTQAVASQGQVISMAQHKPEAFQFANWWKSKFVCLMAIRARHYPLTQADAG